MLTFLKFLKNSINYKLYIVCTILTIVFISIIFYLTIYSNVSAFYDFDINKNINIKIINFSFVFLSNLKIVILNLFLGTITCGIFVISSIIQNILTLSVICNSLYINNKLYLIIRLIPHGVIEIFTITLVLVFAVNNFISIFKIIKYVIQENKLYKKEIKKMLNTNIANVVVVNLLLFLAAIVEYYGSIIF